MRAAVAVAFLLGILSRLVRGGWAALGRPADEVPDVKLKIEAPGPRAAWRFQNGHLFAAGRSGTTHAELLNRLREPWPIEAGWIGQDGKFYASRVDAAATWSINQMGGTR